MTDPNLFDDVDVRELLTSGQTSEVQLTGRWATLEPDERDAFVDNPVLRRLPRTEG